MTTRIERRFAEKVIAAFKMAGHHTDDEIGDAHGPSTTTMSKLRKVSKGMASMATPRGDTFKRIDTAANWKPGSARTVWNGGEPTPAARTARPTLESRVAELERLIARLAGNPGPPEPPEDEKDVRSG